jgi:hypothetical protein
MPNERWVFWLNLTNIGLGVVVLLALLAVGYGVVWEFALRRKRARGDVKMDAELGTAAHDDFAHALHIPELGLTMADGGEPLKPAPSKKATEKREQR